jgi:hypothetical protein
MTREDKWKKSKDNLREFSVSYRGHPGLWGEMGKKADEILRVMELRDARSAEHPGNVAHPKKLDQMYGIPSGTLI